MNATCVKETFDQTTNKQVNKDDDDDNTEAERQNFSFIGFFLFLHI